MKHEAGTRLTMRHENGSVLIGEANGYGQLLVGGSPVSISSGWEVISEAPPVNPEPSGTMAAVVMEFKGSTTPYTYLGHKSGSRWSWTGRTAPAGTWASFLEWVRCQNAEIVNIQRLEVDMF